MGVVEVVLEPPDFLLQRAVGPLALLELLEDIVLCFGLEGQDDLGLLGPHHHGLVDLVELLEALQHALLPDELHRELPSLERLGHQAVLPPEDDAPQALALLLHEPDVLDPHLEAVAEGMLGHVVHRPPRVCHSLLPPLLRLEQVVVEGLSLLMQHCVVVRELLELHEEGQGAAAVLVLVPLVEYGESHLVPERPPDARESPHLPHQLLHSLAHHGGAEGVGDPKSLGVPQGLVDAHLRIESRGLEGTQLVLERAHPLS
mmetsp:Transcript_65818/g.208308  ORF Transcript_65818/g.208308 Transcript_65818/m.208308 type:complete len:259 (+) Transcript_65818:672-1448(+)